MERIIATFSDGTELLYDTGKKDEWCVYQRKDGGEKIPPLDRDYFKQLVELKEKYGDNIYEFFVEVYDKTTKDLNEDVISFIKKETNRRFPEDALETSILYVTLYMAMVAEFYYLRRDGSPSVLNKRVKLLAVHQILKEDMSVYQAANFSRGKSINMLKEECRQRGIEL